MAQTMELMEHEWGRRGGGEGPDQGSTDGEVGMELMNVKLMFFRKWNVICGEPDLARRICI